MNWDIFQPGDIIETHINRGGSRPTRQCLMCYDRKPKAQFHRRGTGSSGVDWYCKTCRAIVDADPRKRWGKNA